MSSYRIQIRSEGKYYDGIIEAQDDVSALRQFDKTMKRIEKVAGAVDRSLQKWSDQ